MILLDQNMTVGLESFVASGMFLSRLCSIVLVRKHRKTGTPKKDAAWCSILHIKSHLLILKKSILQLQGTNT